MLLFPGVMMIIRCLSILLKLLYFFYSLVCIISSHRLAYNWGNLVDEESTSIKSKHSYSVLRWKYKHFRRTILHPSCGLPEMVVNDDIPGLFSASCQFCGSSTTLARAHFCSFATVGGDLSSSSFPLFAVMRCSRDRFTSPCTVLQSIDPAKPDSQLFIKLRCE